MEKFYRVQITKVVIEDDQITEEVVDTDEMTGLCLLGKDRNGDTSTEAVFSLSLRDIANMIAGSKHVARASMIASLAGMMAHGKDESEGE